MNPVKVFYPWQSDIASDLCRNLVQKALGRPCERDEDIVVKIGIVERETVAMFDRLRYVAAMLGLTGQALIAATLYGPEDVAWVEGHQTGRIRSPFLNLGDTVIDELGALAGEYVQPMTDTLLLAAGWPTGSPEFDEDGHWKQYGDTLCASSRHGQAIGRESGGPWQMT